ncbi:MAG: hypothetical protein Q8P59_01390 [Dehalococcoidia bacterium]|nr:hypothetical protein [Dehalococcoidia bacterium]
MITQEAWYREALERDLQRSREKLRTDPTDLQHHLADEAIRAWRVGKASELEELIMEDPEAPGLFDLLMITAQGAGHLPYLTKPGVFFNSRGLNESQRESIMADAFSRSEKEITIREWLFSLVKKGMEFDREHSEKLTSLAIQHAGDEPQLIVTLLEMGNYADSILGIISNSSANALYTAALGVAEATKDPVVLSWLWEPDVFEYHSEDGNPPDVSWEAVLATPEDALPEISFQINFHYIQSNWQDWDTFEGNLESPSLKAFAFPYGNWNDFSWDDVGGLYSSEWILLSPEHTEVVDPDELPEDDEGEGEGDSWDTPEEVTRTSQTSLHFNSTPGIYVKWLRDHWPPPSAGGER